MKTVCLTFDDGPGPATGGVLRVLRESDVRATFFVLGREVQKRPDVLRSIANEGHEIGNHSWSHRKLQDLPLDEVRREFESTSSLIESITGHRPGFARAPGGGKSEAITSAVHALRQRLVRWDVDSFDWQEPDALSIYERAVWQPRDRSIVLLHDGGGPRTGTIEALPAIIDDLRDRGFRFATVSELLLGTQTVG